MASLKHNPKREKYLQFQFLKQHLEQLQEQVGALQQQHMQVESSIAALQEITKTPPHTELFAPLAPGIFLRATIKDTHTVVINVGAEIVVEKTIPQVITLLEQQREEMKSKLDEAATMVQELTAEVMKSYQEVQKEE